MGNLKLFIIAIIIAGVAACSGVQRGTDVGNPIEESEVVVYKVAAHGYVMTAPVGWNAIQEGDAFLFAAPDASQSVQALFREVGVQADPQAFLMADAGAGAVVVPGAVPAVRVAATSLSAQHTKAAGARDSGAIEVRYLGADRNQMLRVIGPEELVQVELDPSWKPEAAAEGDDDDDDAAPPPPVRETQNVEIESPPRIGGIHEMERAEDPRILRDEDDDDDAATLEPPEAPKSMACETVTECTDGICIRVLKCEEVELEEGSDE